ncbi:hypothetical protein H5P36_24500 [Bacillus sp. APMAM]|nr:hypothetical protein [Bacillus sp. APMAM]RTZ53272.1 hypothetical protein EKO25_24240 [Bacillus sp. SAJ1]
MQFIKEGDTIVIPKQSNRNHFLIAEARQAIDSHTFYDFGYPLENTNDYHHIIHIDPESIREVHYPLTPLIVKRLLTTIAYSGPLNFFRNQEDFKQAITEIFLLDNTVELAEPHPLQKATTH